MLHDGQWQGKQVVPSEWIRASSQRHMEQTYPKWSSGGIYGYGYQWWHGEFKKGWGEFTAIAGVGNDCSSCLKRNSWLPFLPATIITHTIQWLSGCCLA
jgi:CubicO group peptidase (beta-lactamase class C family)